MHLCMHDARARTQNIDAPMDAGGGGDTMHVATSPYFHIVCAAARGAIQYHIAISPTSFFQTDE